MITAVMHETAVYSFIVRFSVEATDEADIARWRGLIRHIQSGAEMRFTSVEDALAFMNRTVKLDDEPLAHHKDTKKNLAPFRLKQAG